ncbi:hypothetical protein C6990_02470 [Nitrosopumilus sp. b3]|uniref:hypothetical protein n=1 Tax=Nitrosopumilus sp. b3 TaxID=2109909 RepID=UPI0015F67B82|nr:hypothetical protein [Nitrosopumilus sp. b3]KAF6247352.1 hypothetical protein C6990_02470 [Nitrosopumilus sp. b3]
MGIEILQKVNEKEFLQIVNHEIKICIICGYDKIESFEHGMSCEECGASFGRRKYKGGEMNG